MENKIKARCQLGNKAIKKKTNICWDERKERKEGKNRYAKLNVDKEDLYTLKINCKGKRTVGKANKWVNVEKMQ